MDQREHATGHFVFLSSSIRKQLSFLLSMLLLSCLTCQWFSPIPLPSSTSALTLNADETPCVTQGSYLGTSGVTNTWPRNIRRPVSSVIRNSPRCYYMFVLPGLPKKSTHVHTNKRNPCADGGKEQNQNHSFKKNKDWGKMFAFERQHLLRAPQRSTVIKDKQQLKCILLYLQHWKLQFSFIEGEQCVSFQ